MVALSIGLRTVMLCKHQKINLNLEKEILEELLHRSLLTMQKREVDWFQPYYLEFLEVVVWLFF